MDLDLPYCRVSEPPMPGMFLILSQIVKSAATETSKPTAFESSSLHTIKSQL